MDFNLASRVPIGEEVSQFVTETHRYYAITTSGRRINIIRTKNFQPPIEEGTDFNTYLWVEALEGFFLFFQRFQKGKPGPWILQEEFVPQKREGFFSDFFESYIIHLK
jgi:hypothetical protein